jgi:hypothetical protein
MSISIRFNMLLYSSSQERMRVEIKPTVAPINEEEAAAAMSLVMTHLKSVRKYYYYY